MAFDADTELQRVPEIRLELDSSNLARITYRGETIDGGAHALLVLDLFSKPISARTALERLKPRIGGLQDWVDISGTIMRLYRQGILLDATQRRPALRRGLNGFDAAPIHAQMLNDTTRVTSFLRGIRQVVKAGDVVVDIGTGTGVLAIAAARAGAKQVYAVEASSIGRVAQAVFEANQVADRVTLVSGWSTQIELPERADVLVSEIIGNEPLDEHVLETTADAHRRLLKPNARVLPARLKIMAVAVTVPNAQLNRLSFTEQCVAEWRASYGIDFSPLCEEAREVPLRFYVRPATACSWPTFCQPITLADIDLTAVREPLIRTAATATTTMAGQMTGLVVYFELEVASGIWLSTGPGKADDRCSWHAAVSILPQPLLVEVGDTIRVKYDHAGSRGGSEIGVERE